MYIMSKKIKLIIGSVRQGRLGEPVSNWVVTQAKAAGIDLEVLDLKQIDIPFLEAPIPPAYAPVDTPKAKEWAAMIADADGIVFVTPEYNRSIPASLKNAIDHLSTEWKGKKAAVISYGYVDGGANAASHLKDVFDWVKISVVEPVTNIMLTQEMMSDQGGFKDVDSALSSYKDSVISALKAL
jgi:NAD(P)H-dependent FMN reductase